MTRLLALRCASALFLLVTAQVQAQPIGSLGEDFLYRVQPGDTLSELAQTYIRNSQAWRQLQTLNNIEDPYRMPVALTLRIPLRLIPRETAQARLLHVRGPVHVGDTPAVVGQLLPQGSVLTTTHDGHVTVALEDDTLITLTPDTKLHLDHLEKFQGTNLTDTIIQVPGGALETTVAPSGSGVGRFEVRTPMAVTGVRGTRFWIQSTAEGQLNSVTEGSVRLQTRPDGDKPGTPTLLDEGYGSVISADGTLLGSWPLLPAPAVSTPVREAGLWVARITPVAGAVAYEITISHDPEGHLRVSSTESRDTDIRIAPPGANAYHLIVRAIDEHAIRGRDTRLDITGDNVLVDSQGDPVLDSPGSPILLKGGWRQGR